MYNQNLWQLSYCTEELQLFAIYSLQSALLPRLPSAAVSRLALWGNDPVLFPFQTCHVVLDQIFA